MDQTLQTIQNKYPQDLVATSVQLIVIIVYLAGSFFSLYERFTTHTDSMANKATGPSKWMLILTSSPGLTALHLLQMIHCKHFLIFWGRAVDSRAKAPYRAAAITHNLPFRFVGL